MSMLSPMQAGSNLKFRLDLVKNSARSMSCSRRCLARSWLTYMSQGSSCRGVY